MEKVEHPDTPPMVEEPSAKPAEPAEPAIPYKGEEGEQEPYAEPAMYAKPAIPYKGEEGEEIPPVLQNLFELIPRSVAIALYNRDAVAFQQAVAEIMAAAQEFMDNETTDDEDS